MHTKKQYLIDTFGHDPESLDDLAHCTILMIDNHFKKSQSSNRVVGFSWNIVEALVSNSHSCPLSGVRNFSGNPNYPRNYPGFSGRVWIRFEEMFNGASNSFADTLTHTGTGGYGGYNGPWQKLTYQYYKLPKHNENNIFKKLSIFTWDYRFFLDDFPELANNIERTKLWKMLKDKPSKISHQFFWDDPDTVEQDQEFLNFCNSTKKCPTMI